MSIFRCNNCGCVDNTSTSGYWKRVLIDKKDALCSECNPELGEWHGEFEKKSADGMLLCNDGYLYGAGYEKTDSYKWRHEHQKLEILGVVNGDKLEALDGDG